MRFAISAIVIQNFKSFAGKHVLKLEDLGPGLHRVRGKNLTNPDLGPNGAGKSTAISDAVSWCLYGRTTQGAKNPDVRPWAGEGTTVVRIRTEGNVIRRTIAPNSLTLDGEAVGQEQIDAAVGMPFEVFTHTVLLGQGQPLFYDLDPREKMALFVPILGLERWDVRSQAAADRAKELLARHDRLTGERAVLQANTTQIEPQLERALTDRDTWAEAAAKKLETAERDLKRLAKFIDEREAQAGKLNLAYDSASTEERALRVQIASAIDAQGGARDALSKYDAEHHAQGVRRKELIAELRAIGDKCPVCKQSVKGSQHIVSHKRELKAKIAEYGDGVPDAKYERAVRKADAVLERLQAAQIEFNDKATKARDALDSITGPLADAKAEHAALKAQHKQRRDERNPYLDQVKTLRRQKEQTEQQLVDCDERMTVLLRRHERAKFWVKGFRDVRLYVLEELLQELELATNAMLDEFGLRGWHVEYQMERETNTGKTVQGLNVVILSPDNEKPVRWHAWSGGEAQRLRLVGSLALAEVLLARAGVTPMIEILDEPTRHLSAEGVRNMCEHLAERARINERQILYIDHASVDSSRFASVTMIVKDKKGSRFQ